MTIKMEVGDPYPRFMHYHPEEMGFGGPDVWFEWNEMGWIMEFIPKKHIPVVRQTLIYFVFWL